MSDTTAVNYAGEIPDVLQALQGVHAVMDTRGMDRTLHHLLRLRASQINGCAHCVRMHSKEARDHGETSERLDSLVVWSRVGAFTDREKAALAWAEALTVLGGPAADYGALRARLREHFTDSDIAILTTTVAMINVWNRLQVAQL